MRTFAFLLLALLASPSVFIAQAPPAPAAATSKAAFTAEDMLKVATLSVLDLSDDGRQVAVAARRLQDNAEVDNTRYGDPTYMAPAFVRLIVIDTASGATQTPFKELVNVQQASWSHDGKHLAVITAVNGGAPKMGQPSLPVVRLSIWDADRAVLAEVSLKDDGRAFAYAKKGEVFVQRIDEARPRSLTSDVNEKPASPSPAAAPGTAGSTPAPAAGTIAAPDDPDKKEQFSVISFSRDGAVLLATTKKAWYAIRVGDGSRRSLMTLDPDKEETSPKIDPIGWSPDGEGLFATWSARDTWERGLVRINVANGEMTSLVKDARLFGGFRFSRDGRTVVFTLSDGDQPAELYAADSGFAQIRRLTGVNEWIAASRTLPRSELVSYRDSDGKLIHGVLRYPVNYVKGQKYPTMFEIYETFFDNGFNGRAAFLANHGYAVFHPSVNLIQTRPGEAWIKGVTSAANRLIEMDSARRPRQDAAALHHRRPGSERAVEPVARDVLRAPAARQGGGVGALRERRPPPAQQRG